MVSAIGAGGMGEVYRATDTKLKRQVAIKILPPSLAADRDRLARFQREAEVLASLNHPNIAHIHGLEESGGMTALVMELVEGDDLSQRIARGAIPVDEALPIAKQIAEALEAAHERGIVHRDLKPANVKVRDDGTVKVLDFGLAKAHEPAAGASVPGLSTAPTMTSPAMTQMGMILGTAAYMSPEQAKGRPVDARADVWAFGVVLFEMLSGHRAFDGEDVTEMLGAVVRLDPNWDLLPPALPSRVRRVIQACLQKNVKARLASMQDVRLALDGVLDSSTPAAGPATARLRLWQRPLPIAAAIVIAAGLGALAAWRLAPPSPAPHVSRFEIAVPDGRTFRNTGRRVVAISPDGRQLAFNFAGGVYVRRMDEVEARLVAGTEAGLTSPTFSPDGQSMAYVQAGQVFKIGAGGGGAVGLGPIVNELGLSWGADGTIVAGAPDGIWQFFPSGAQPVRIAESSGGGELLSNPQILPGGEWLLMTQVRPDHRPVVVAQSLRSKERRTILEDAFDGRYVATGHLLFQQGEAGLFGVAFDPARLESSGQHISLLPALGRASVTNSGNYGISDNGTFVYLPSDGLGQTRRLAWLSRAGTKLGDLGFTAVGLVTPELSPDGGSVAYAAAGATRVTAAGSAAGSPSTATALEIWNHVLAAGTNTLVSRGGDVVRPIWSPDGQQVAFNQRGGGSDIFVRRSDGTGAVDAFAAPGLKHVGDWSRDGRVLLFDWNDGPQNPGTSWDIFFMTRSTPDGAWDHQPRALAVEPGGQFVPKLSPNGRYVAYISNETGRSEVYVRSFPDGRRRWLVSNNGGTRQRWSRDGTELFYIEGGLAGTTLMVSDVSTAGEFSHGRPRQLLQNASLAIGINDIASYDVSKDGQRFLVVEPVGREAAQPTFVVVENWFEELKRRVPIQ